MEERGKEILQELKEIKELLRIIASNTEQKEVELKIGNLKNLAEKHQLFGQKKHSGEGDWF